MSEIPALVLLADHLDWSAKNSSSYPALEAAAQYVARELRILSEAAAQPQAPITAEDVRAAERAWNARHLTHNKDKPAFVADYLNRRGERA